MPYLKVCFAYYCCTAHGFQITMWWTAKNIKACLLKLGCARRKWVEIGQISFGIALFIPNLLAQKSNFD